MGSNISYAVELNEPDVQDLNGTADSSSINDTCDAENSTDTPKGDAESTEGGGVDSPGSSADVAAGEAPHGALWVKAYDMGKVDFQELKGKGITDIFLEQLAFNDARFRSNLTSFLGNASANGLRVSVWVICLKDSSGNWFDPTQEFIDNLTQRVLGYTGISGVGGVHLDYIRYPGNAYQSPGATEAITGIVKRISEAVKSVNPEFLLSAALMPEKGVNAYYYGQDYTKLAEYLDVLIPMAYKGNYREGSSWIENVSAYIKSKSLSAEVWTGLQTYRSDADVTPIPADELLGDINAALRGGADGYALFRYGLIDREFLGGVPAAITKPVADNSLTSSMIMDAASRVKAFVESNHRLPNYVTVGEMQVTPGEFLYMLAGLISGRTPERGSFSEASDINLTASGTIQKEEYLRIASDVLNYMSSTGNAPSRISSTAGDLSFNVLLYIFSKIVAFQEANGRLPNYVTVDSSVFSGKIDREFLGGVPAAITKPVADNSLTSSMIMDAASRVKAFVESNHRLPNYVTVGEMQVTPGEFLYMLAGLISGRTPERGSFSEASDINLTASGTIQKEEYLRIASDVLNYMSSTGNAPSRISSTAGDLSFNVLLYIFSKIVAFQEANGRLPNYVTVDSSVFSGKYLAATANCQVGSPEIRALASSITKGLTSALSKATAIFNWVRDNISYSFYYNTRYGALGTLKNRSGNCVDITHLLVALSRAAGIQARYVHAACTFISGNTYGHVWAQLYVNGAWVNADASSNMNSFGVIKNWNSASIKGYYEELPF